MSNYNSNSANDGSKEPKLIPAPKLPLEAQLPPDLGLDACPWLDQYVEFSQKWSSRSFDGYHEAVGLWVLSTVAARRILVTFGKGLYTNLYILLVGRTSLYAKSTAAHIGRRLIDKIGLPFLLLPEDLTPQKMIRLMSNQLPEGFIKLSPDQKEKILKDYAFVGQKGLYCDEYGANLENMTKSSGPYGEFHGLLRKLHDTEETYTKGTLVRGVEEISMPYISLLGALTPSDIANVAARNSKFWGDGYLARMGLVSPPVGLVKEGRFPDGMMEIEESLLKPIRDWHLRLGIPKVKAVDGKVVQDTSKCVSRVSLSAETREAYYRYDSALRNILQDMSLTDLDGNYARFPEKALRIAALFASLGGSNVINLNHWAKAQAISERWRTNLHSLYKQVNSEKTALLKWSTTQKVLNEILTNNYPTCREIQQSTGLNSRVVAEELDKLTRAGKVISEKAGRTLRYRINSPQPASAQQPDVSDQSLDLYDHNDVEEEVEENALPSFEDTADKTGLSTDFCYMCGRSEFWQRPDGGWVCSICHPNPKRQPIAQERGNIC